MPRYGLLLLLLPVLAQASAWRGVTPGVTPATEIQAKFGEPSQTVRVKGKEVLSYLAHRAPKGTTQVQFRISEENQLVDRIDVFPKNVIDRATIESTYGGACPHGADATTVICYRPQLSPDGRSYLVYPALGLAIFLRADGKTVFSIVFGTPAQGHPPVAKNEGTGTSTGTETGTGNTATGTGSTQEGHASEPPPPVTTADNTGTESTDPTASSAPSSFAVTASTPEDTLKIGGTLYVRAAAGMADTSAKGDPKTSVDTPMLMDVYLDGRPNDRIRGFLVGRMIYDPLANPNGQISPLGIPQAAAPNPQILLDQFWLKFDIAHQVFFTLGRQHVKWGVSKLWSPVDFLSTVKLDPLALFDLRVGTDMLRVHVPISSLGANFYGVAFVDTLGRPDKPLRVGGAARVEALVLGAELALSAAVQDQRKPRFGFDFSTPLGPLPLDVYGEVALFNDTDTPVWQVASNPDPSLGYPGQFEQVKPKFPVIQSSAGLKWQIAIDDNSSAEVGAEGFINTAGYTDPTVLPWLYLSNSYQSLYAARSYAALYASYTHTKIADGLTLALFGVANLADQSMATRLNLSIRVLTDLNLEATVGLPLGHRGGEFNFEAHIPSYTDPAGDVTKAIDAYPQVAFGQVGIRIDI